MCTFCGHTYVGRGATADISIMRHPVDIHACVCVRLFPFLMVSHIHSLTHTHTHAHAHAHAHENTHTHVNAKHRRGICVCECVCVYTWTQPEAYLLWALLSWAGRTAVGVCVWMFTCVCTRIQQKKRVNQIVLHSRITKH